MPEDPLEERLAAVERALTDGDEPAPDLSVPDDLCDRVEALEEDVAELEAAVQAVRGYVGSVKHVNDEVERRADAAMAKAEALERSLADGGNDANMASPGPTPSGCPRCGAGQGVRDSALGESRDGSTPGGRRDGSEPADRRDGPGSRDRDGPSGATTDRDRDRIADDGTGGRDGTAGSAGPYPSNGDRGETGGPPSDPGRGRVGHRRLEAPDEADGLIARLREVL